MEDEKSIDNTSVTTQNKFQSKPKQKQAKQAKQARRAKLSHQEKMKLKSGNIDTNFGGPFDKTIYKDNELQLKDLTNIYKTDLKGNDETNNDTISKIVNELNNKELNSYRLIRAPSDYYQKPLEYRRQCLNAPDVKYLCKSLLMKNTKATVNDCSDPTNSLYYIVIFVKYIYSIIVINIINISIYTECMIIICINFFFLN